MYLPAYFSETDLQKLVELVELNPLIDLITSQNNELIISQLPVLISITNDLIVLRGHWARANPQSISSGHATILVRGPNHYISPTWYPDKAKAARVPTWNYASAQLRGQLRRFDDEKSLAQIVTDLATHFETKFQSDWKFDFENPKERSQLRGIVGFEFIAEKIEMKFKLSQNHPLVNQISIARNLEKIGAENAVLISRMIRAKLS